MSKRVSNKKAGRMPKHARSAHRTKRRCEVWASAGVRYGLGANGKLMPFF
jgi:hypothetical protein